MTMEPLRGAGDLRVAVIVDPDLPLGLLANTIAAISIGLGGCHPAMSGLWLADAKGVAIRASADRPIPILQADGDRLRNLLVTAAAQENDLTLVAFPAFARSLHEFAEYEHVFPTRTLADEKIDGVGLAGPTRLIRSLTGSLKLLR